MRENFALPLKIPYEGGTVESKSRWRPMAENFPKEKHLGWGKKNPR